MTNSFDDYQTRTATTAIYPEKGTGSRVALSYVALGLGETGEVQGKIGDLLTTGHTAQNLAEVGAELGDVLWYIARFATEVKQTLTAIAATQMPAGTTDVTIAQFQHHVATRNGALPSVERAALALGSAGDLQGLVKKILRGDPASTQEAYTGKLINELALLLTNVAILATVLGVQLGDVAQGNLDKLADRANRGTLKGAGDHR